MVSVQQEGVMYSKNDQFVALVLLVMASSFEWRLYPPTSTQSLPPLAHSTVLIRASQNMTLNVNSSVYSIH
jgi:hypothetical protein